MNAPVHVSKRVTDAVFLIRCRHAGDALRFRATASKKWRAGNQQLATAEELDQRESRSQAGEQGRKQQ
jgi:hypothetical protein